MTKPISLRAVTVRRLLAATTPVAAALALAAPAQAAGVPAPAAPAAASVAAAHEAATAPATLDTLSRFFARDGAVGLAQARPRIEGRTVPVYVLSPDFVRGKRGAPVSQLEFLASKAVSSDGQKASVWTARAAGAWKVVNIATGDDETRYAAAGDGGTVFREPQIDAWYVQRGDRVLPLDEDAKRAVGARGVTVAAYQKRVAKAYGDKLPGSAYAKRGEAGGYGPEAAGPDHARTDDARASEARADAAQAPRTAALAEASTADADGPLTTVSAVAGAGAALVLGLGGTVAVRRLRRR
ncbi:hypothetical protein [Streptomyces sp. NPDC003077]|uniref:hypothetical protein n=1 Tax=Streptomyces sp. NPDC003077 TaxID=3154443 RepID=UPI0033A07881